MFDKCLIFGFSIKNYKMEVFETIFCFFFIAKPISMGPVLHLKNIQKCLIWVLLQNKNNKNDDRKRSYKMLIIGPSGSGKTNALPN